MIHFHSTWDALGPFSIGTREDPWHDSVEIANLVVSEHGFPSALTRQAKWKSVEMDLLEIDETSTKIELQLSYSDVNWKDLEKTFGWAATQFDAWVCGSLEVEEDCVLSLNVRNSPEYILDGERYEGDIYGLGVPLILPFTAGRHSLYIRVINEIRIFGYKPDPLAMLVVEAKVYTESDVIKQPLRSCARLPDIVQTTKGEVSYSTRHGDISLSNISDATKIIHAIDIYQTDPGFGKSMRLRPYQTRLISIPVPRITDSTLLESLWSEVDLSSQGSSLKIPVPCSAPRSSRISISQPHIITYLNTDGTVGRAVLRPPKCGKSNSKLGRHRPILLALHGAGVEIDDLSWKNAFAKCYEEAWILQPDCGKWGDDWHSRSAQSITCALNAIPEWIERHKWQGPGVSLDRILIIGHSNGAQGAMQFIVRNSDRLIGAAFAAGYTSIARYVPYSMWTSNALHVADRPEYDIIKNLAMFKGVKCFVKHGVDDDNVPIYHSQLLASLDDSIELEQVSGKGHYWDQTLTEGRIKHFVERQLAECQVNRPDTFTILSWGRPIQKGGIKINAIEDSVVLPARITVEYSRGENGSQSSLDIITHGVKAWSFTDPQAYEDVTEFELNRKKTHSISEFSDGEVATIDQRDLACILESTGPISVIDKISYQPDSYKIAFGHRIAHAMLLYHSIDCDILSSNDTRNPNNNAIILRQVPDRKDTGIEVYQPKNKNQIVATLDAYDAADMSKLIRLLPWRTGTGVPGYFRIDLHGKTNPITDAMDVDLQGD